MGNSQSQIEESSARSQVSGRSLAQQLELADKNANKQLPRDYSREYILIDPTQNCKPLEAPKVDQEHQETSDRDLYLPYCSQHNYQVYENTRGERYDRYQVRKSSKQMTAEEQDVFLEHYHYRLTHPSRELVQILFFSSLRKTHTFVSCVSPKVETYSIVTEHIQYRLRDLFNLSFYNALIALRVALKGYGNLYRFNGLIWVKDDMIGVNQQNEVKVWLSNNFAINFTDPTSPALKNISPEKQENYMVHNIVDLISSKADHSSNDWNGLVQVIKGQPLPSTFQSTLSIVERAYEIWERGRVNQQFFNQDQSNRRQYPNKLEDPFNQKGYQHTYQNHHFGNSEIGIAQQLNSMNMHAPSFNNATQNHFRKQPLLSRTESSYVQFQNPFVQQNQYQQSNQTFQGHFTQFSQPSSIPHDFTNKVPVHTRDNQLNSQPQGVIANVVKVDSQTEHSSPRIQQHSIKEGSFVKKPVAVIHNGERRLITDRSQSPINMVISPKNSQTDHPIKCLNQQHSQKVVVRGEHIANSQPILIHRNSSTEQRDIRNSVNTVHESGNTLKKTIRDSSESKQAVLTVRESQQSDLRQSHPESPSHHQEQISGRHQESTNSKINIKLNLVEDPDSSSQNQRDQQSLAQRELGHLQESDSRPEITKTDSLISKLKLNSSNHGRQEDEIVSKRVAVEQTASSFTKKFERAQIHNSTTQRTMSKSKDISYRDLRNLLHTTDEDSD